MKQFCSGNMTKLQPKFAVFFFTLLSNCCIILTLETTTVPTNTTTENIETTDITLPPLLPTNVEKLVRYRRHPPITIVKHVYRSTKYSKPRRRYKRPKVKYGPPSYNYGEPITYYKSHAPESSADHSTFSVEDLKQLNFDVTDLDVPPSSYEAQTIDLDMYSHGGNAVYHHAPKSPKVEYSYDAEPETPGYSYPTHSQSTADKPEISITRAPHQKYGVPKHYEYAPSNYETHSVPGGKYQEPEPYAPSSSYSDESYSSHISSDEYASFAPQPEEPSDYNAPTHTKQYGPSAPPKVPDSYAPSSIQTKYEAPTAHAPVDYGPPSSGQHHFAEPPATKAEIEISYSPSYEITLPSSKHAPAFKHYEAPPTQNYGGNFAEPPASNPAPQKPHYQPNDYAEPPKDSYHPSPNSVGDYLPPPSQELPLNPNHKPHTYDYPKSSYEVPIYDPVPFDASNTDVREYYPPNSYGNAQQPETGHKSHAEDSLEYTPEAATPDSFEHSTDLSFNAHTEDAHTSSSSTTSETSSAPRRRRKRKRIRGSTTRTSTKHILDAPELVDAYVADQRYKYGVDTDAYASTRVEQKQNFQQQFATSTTDSENFISSAWNPIRIRTSTGTYSTPSSSTTVALERPIPVATGTIRKRMPFFKSRTSNPSQPTMQVKHEKLETVTISPKLLPSTGKVSLLSIDQSHSQSYYDGTIAPPVQTTANLYKTRLQKFKGFTRSTTTTTAADNHKQPTDSHGTTRSMFDTTYFKSPQNNKDQDRRLSLLVQNLPKNHKPF